MTEPKHPENPIRILLGGGIGSGKSVALRKMEERGATVVEADHLGHAVLERDGEAFGAVTERWPSALVEDEIDRGVLAEIVFADQEQLLELERTTHPAIITLIAEFASSAQDVVIEIPVILDVPGDWKKVFVDANRAGRLWRAVARGNDPADVRRRMASQPTRDEWLSWCDKMIDNNGSVEDLEGEVNSLWDGLRATGNGLRR